MEHRQEVESRPWQNHCLHHFAATAEPAIPEKLVAAGEVVLVPPAFWLQWHSEPQGTKGTGVCYPIPLACSGVAWKLDNPGHGRDTCTPAPLRPSPYFHSNKACNSVDPKRGEVPVILVPQASMPAASRHQRPSRHNDNKENDKESANTQIQPEAVQVRETKICAIAPPTEKPEKGL